MNDQFNQPPFPTQSDQATPQEPQAQAEVPTPPAFIQQRAAGGPTPMNPMGRSAPHPLMGIFSVEPVTATVMLPSRGLPYGDAIPDGKITVIPMTAREEKLIAGMKGDINAVLDTLFQRCFVTNGINPDSLVVGDRMYMFFTLRANTYGTDYTFNLKCPSCSLKFAHSVDLSKMDVTYLADDWQEPFYVDLPLSKKRIGLKLLRGEDQKFIDKAVEQAYKKKVQEGDVAYPYRIAKAIVSIDGYEVKPNEFMTLLQMVDKLQGADSWEIRKALEENDCGLNLMINLDCPKCDNMIEDYIPMTADFFRPRKGR